MKNKVIMGALAVLCVVSVGFNIYQYNTLNASRQQLSDTQAQLDNMTSNYADLDTQLTAMQEEIDSLNTSISDKQSEIDSLTQENSDLMNSISVEEGVEDEADVEVEEPTESIVAVEPSESDKDVVDASTPNPNDTGFGTFTYDKDGYWKSQFGWRVHYVDGYWYTEDGGMLVINGDDGVEHADVANDGRGIDIPEEYLDALRAIQWE